MVVKRACVPARRSVIVMNCYEAGVRMVVTVARRSVVNNCILIGV